MKKSKKMNRLLTGILACVLALALGAGLPAVPAYAASGSVYTCSITPCYRHPVTGVIEDSGGEASYATGQGMVEGVVYPTGIIEVTDNGAYYLTIRMSLMDYTSNHSFWVQNVGDSSWSSPSEIGITGNGTDSNGTTADICMRVPSENCVVRGAMYVGPMGRDVVFYLYPSNYSAGNNTNMNATIVTSGSGSSGSSGSTSAGNSTAGSTSGSTSGGTSGSSLSGSGSLSAGTTALEGGDSDDASDTTGTLSGLESSITAPATSDTTTDTDSTLNSAQGLSLSTAEGSDAEETSEAVSAAAVSPIALVLVITLAVLLVIGVVAFIVYFFHKNWRRWGGGEDDEGDENDG